MYRLQKKNGTRERLRREEQVWAITVDEYTHTEADALTQTLVDIENMSLSFRPPTPFGTQNESFLVSFFVFFFENNGKRPSILCMENNNLLSGRSEDSSCPLF